MGEINKIEVGALARSSKVNEIIPIVNALQNMTVREAEGDEATGINVADNNAELIVPAGGEGGANAFNGTVAICIDGAPYWINIPYDSEKGAYDASEIPDFPIEAPEE